MWSDLTRFLRFLEDMATNGEPVICRISEGVLISVDLGATVPIDVCFPPPSADPV
jgi:hypothetical protein